MYSELLSRLRALNLHDVLMVKGVRAWGQSSGITSRSCRKEANTFSIQLFLYLPVRSSLLPSLSPSLHPSSNIHPSIHPFIQHLSIYLFIRLSIHHPSVCPSLCLSSIHLSIHSVCPSVLTFVHSSIHPVAQVREGCRFGGTRWS